MDDEKLIELVRENSVLYDTSHPKYMDPKFKMSVWHSIGDILNISGAQCKGRWNNIRDHFRRHMQKRKNMTAEAAENRKRYKYEEYLQFLVPYTNDRDTLTYNPVQEMPSMTEEIDDSKEAPTEEHSDVETSPSVARRIFSNRSRMYRSHYPSTPPEMPSALLMKYLLDKEDPENVTRVPSHDDIDTFLIGIASSLKKLNPYHRHIAKGRIFNIVHELEAQEFFGQTNASNLSSRHSIDSDSHRSNVPT